MSAIFHKDTIMFMFSLEKRALLWYCMSTRLPIPQTARNVTEQTVHASKTRKRVIGMDFNINTKLTDILAKYPWLPDELVKMDSRFQIIKTPVGKMMMKNATVKDACEKTGMSEQDLFAQLQKMIQEHKG